MKQVEWRENFIISLTFAEILLYFQPDFYKVIRI